MTQAQIITDLKVFLESLQNSDFKDEERLTFEELDIFVASDKGAWDYVRNDFLADLYDRNHASRRSLLYFANSTIKYSTSNLAVLCSDIFIDIYCESIDNDVLTLLIDLILTFRLLNQVNLENDGNQLRIIGTRSSFVIDINLIQLRIRLNILRLLMDKYSRTMVEDGPPHVQEIHATLARLNFTIQLIEKFEPLELRRYTALTPFLISNRVTYHSVLAAKLFNTEVGSTDFDEELYHSFRIPLFPKINEDKFEVMRTRVRFWNEGPGYLSPAKLRISVADDEIELGETQRAIAPNDEYSLYILDIQGLVGFLRQYNPNFDAKAVVSFRKFGRTYEYSLLTGLVGEWLEKLIDAHSSVDLVMPHNIPLNDLSSKHFEQLCYWIVSEYKTDSGEMRFERVYWFSEDGGGEMGQDVIAVERSTQKKFVFQCKRVEKFGPKDIEEELETFRSYVKSNPNIRPDEYVLFVSSALTLDTKKRGDQIASEIGMAIDYWTKSTIDRLVRTNELVRNRFWNIVREAHTV